MLHRLQMCLMTDYVIERVNNGKKLRKSFWFFFWFLKSLGSLLELVYSLNNSLYYFAFSGSGATGSLCLVHVCQSVSICRVWLLNFNTESLDTVSSLREFHKLIQRTGKALNLKSFYILVSVFLNKWPLVQLSLISKNFSGFMSS